MSIPRVWPEYTTKRVMVGTTACKECSLLGCVFTTLGAAVFHQVMDFCEGFAIKNLEMLDERKVDREALLQTVTSAFAHQIFVDGCFNADPHPGNSTWTAVLWSAFSQQGVVGQFWCSAHRTASRAQCCWTSGSRRP